MAEGRKPYVVTIGGLPHTLLLTREGAARYGDQAVEAKGREPQNKARIPRNKSAK